MEFAIRNGNLHGVQKLIRSGANVNARSAFGNDPMLIMAISLSQEKIALALLAAGADVHAKCNMGQTAISWACRKQLEQVVQALIDRGSRVDALDVNPEHSLPWMAKDNTAISMALLRAGASCRGLSTDSVDGLFRRASSVSDLLAVGTLLKNGCSISALSAEQQDGLLRSAYRERNLFVAGTLLAKGCGVSALSNEEQEHLLRCAYRERNLLVAGAFLTNPYTTVTLSREKLEELLHCACREGDTFVARTLLENGCSVSTLSRGEQENLLFCACRDGNIFVARTLLKARCSASKLSHAELVQLLESLPKQEKEGLLHGACIKGDELIAEALIAVGCNVNCVNSTGDTPLMSAVCEGHEEVVRKLILEGANVAMTNANGDTALHLAANYNHIQCGVLLAEGGASVRIKNKHSFTPLNAGKAAFQEAVKHALSFTTRKTLCIIGNAEGGKSTLIAALQAESTGFLGRIFNRFRRLNDRRKRTAGIETVSHSSQKYGEVLFFDFAGQDDYHGPHQMFLESLLSKPGVSMTLLLVIKVTETEESILHQLHRWLTPVALMSTTASPPHVIIIGSFLDKVQSKHEATGKLIRCMEVTKCDLVELPLQFIGTCFLNCRQPQSNGIDQLCSFLQEIPVPEFTATHAGYSLAWVLSQIRSSIKALALQLQEFSAWIEGNEDNLPQTIPSPEVVCQDLSAAGHALYLPNKEDPSKSWLVLDLPSILHDVYGTLFSHSQANVQEFGLLRCRHLAELFPDLDLAMVQQLLISLEFCIPVDPSVLKVELSKLTQIAESNGWLFFPALISLTPQPSSKGLLKESVHYLCWQLRTSKKHSISARILQTILLRLAAHFVVKQHDEEGVRQHCCSVWWNGITWQSTFGVDVTVHITNNRVIQVIAASKTADELCSYLIHIVSDIVSTICRLSPNLAAAAYIVHPPNMATSPEEITGLPPKQLFPVEGVRNSIREQGRFVLSLKDTENPSTRMSVVDLFGGCTPSLENIEKIIWMQPVSDWPKSPIEPSQPEIVTGGTDSQVALPGAQALLDISSTLSMRGLDELVVTPVAANWQRLALRLGVKGCISEIVSTNYPNNCERACRDMLCRWLRGEQHTGEEERTWSTLLTALGRAGFVDLERSLRREHFMKE